MKDRVVSSVPFINLHGHSLSTNDSLGYPEDLMNFVYENGMNCCAITDHGVMTAFPYQLTHQKRMKSEGKEFKNIYGSELYVIESLDEWRKEYKEHRDKLKEDNEKKKKPKLEIAADEDEESGSVVEDEAETKSATKSRLNRRYHMVILAQNQKGLNNLFWLISHSFTGDNFYRFPRVDFQMLKEHSEGLIATSACIGNYYGKTIAADIDKGEEYVYQKMKEINSQMIDIFGDCWYNELQWNGIENQHILNRLLIRLSKETGVKLVSTADFHIPRPELWLERELYKKLAWLSKSIGKDQEEEFYSLPKSINDLKYHLYPKNGDQMYESYKHYSKLCNVAYNDDIVLQSITESVRIADRIEDFVPDTSIKLPDFVVPEGKEANEYLREMAYEALKAKKLDIKKEYVQRLETELDVIEHRQFSRYFLTMKAIMVEAAKLGITSPGRGSVGGSLLAYLLEITQSDPVKYGMQFERFLSKGSTSFPDIDIDISENAELKQHLINLWGQYGVVFVSNFNTLKPRSLIKDLSKFFGIPFQEVNEVTGKMLFEATPLAKQKNDIQTGAYEPTLDELKEFSPTLQNFFVKYPEIEKYVTNLSKQIRNTSTHASGTIVSKNLDSNMPLIASKGKLQTPWAEGQNVRHLEDLGFIKFDLLGLATLRIIQDTIDKILTEKNGTKPTIFEIREFYDQNLHPDIIDYNNKKVYSDIFDGGKWIGIFQFDSPGMQQLCQRAKPKSVVELATISAIYRPGPLAANVDELYVQAREDPDSVEYLHPSLKTILSSSSGLLIFQEQIAQLTSKLGRNISLDDGNEIRKLLTKRGLGSSAKDKLKQYKQKFIDGCVSKDISEKVAISIWEMVDRFSQYSFNFSHVLSYSMLSFTCAYLLHYYPKHWCCAYLDGQPEDKKEKAISLVRNLGFTILPPDINKSQTNWIALDDNTLIQPLLSLKGLGEAAIEQIINNRPFHSIEELLFNDNIVYSKLNKKSLDVLCRSGCLDSLMDDRFAGDKHFWSHVAVDRQKTLKSFQEDIDKYRSEGSFSRDEKMENIVSLTGCFPIEMVLTDKVRNSLDRFKIPPISKYDPELGNSVFFVIRSIELRKTKTGKDYAILTGLDTESVLTKIKVWGFNPIRDKVSINHLYIANVDHNPQFGYSIRAYPLNKNLKLLS